MHGLVEPPDLRVAHVGRIDELGVALQAAEPLLDRLVAPHGGAERRARKPGEPALELGAKGLRIARRAIEVGRELGRVRGRIEIARDPIRGSSERGVARRGLRSSGMRGSFGGASRGETGMGAI